LLAIRRQRSEDMAPSAEGVAGLPAGPASHDCFVPRDLFPLPNFESPKYGPERVSRRVLQKRNARSHILSWANAGVQTLNGLAGVGHVDASTKSSQMQLYTESESHFCLLL
jgi:hypothetical protein